MENEDGIWLTNITQKDIYLPDLGVRVKSMKSMNLLPDIMKGTIELADVEKSINNGFLFLNKGKIFYKFSKPNRLIPEKNTCGVSLKPIIRPQRSFIDCVEEQFEELNIVDEVMINDEIKEYEENK